MKEDAKIIRRDCITISPYVKIVQKDVQFQGNGRIESYHGISGNDYVCMVALTKDGKIPLVRQFRPIIEKYVWELPAGTIDHGETPEDCAVRELYEETGFTSKVAPAPLGRFAADSGRLELFAHGFFFIEIEKKRGWKSEEDVECKMFTAEELNDLINGGEFPHIMHVAYLYLSKLLKV
jgi:ADP-ribose pyrophosphatase